MTTPFRGPRRRCRSSGVSAAREPAPGGAGGRRAEIADAAAWYEGRRADLGLAYLREVEAVLDRLVLAPFEFAVVSEGEAFRRARLNRFPFHVFFEVVGEKVVVLAVAHERRRPGYWRAR